MRNHSKLVGFFLLYAGLQACTGGSACSGCVEPIPGGFPLEQRIANSAQARLTPNAITFLETNFSAIVATLMPDGLSFDIPESTTDIAGIGTVTICPGGGCTATINITGVDIQPTPPSSLVLVAQLEVVTSNIRISTERNFTCLWLSGFECDMDVDTRRASPPNNTMRATLTLTIDTRTGYTNANVTDAGLADGIQSDDISISAANTCGAVWCSIADIGIVKDIIVGQLESTLTDTLTSQLSTFTCMACPDAPATCPTGTTCDADSGFCEYSDGTCAGMLLGLEGRTDLGTMMASVSPGLSALVDFVFAAGGYANVDGNGLNLGAYGGLEAVTPNACVPADYVADWLTYAPAPIAPEFSSGNDFTACRRCPEGTECSAGYSCADSGRCEDAAGACESVTQPVMVKLGLAERYLNRAGAGLFESGMLCLGLGTSTVAQLNYGKLALLMPAIDRLTWGDTAPVSIEVRPQLPPRFLIGDLVADPLLGVEPDGRSLSIVMDDAQLDFYLWMLDRWIRVLTVEMDLDVGLRLEAEAGQLVPAITGIAVQSSCMPCPAAGDCPSPSTCDGTVCMNSDGSCELVSHVEVTDAQIIGPPNNINDLFTDLLGLVAGMVPPFSPIALPEFSGFVLEIPDGGITSVSQGGENFLAIYANLAMAPPPSPHVTDTYARLTALALPADDLAARAPVRLREILPVATIDVAAHSDVVSASRFDYRWRVDEGSWSAWTRATRLTVSDPRLAFAGEHAVDIQSRLADDDSTIDPTPVRVPVHVEDVRPYVRTVHRAPGRDHPSEALRGRPETTPESSGCGCAVPGRGSSSTGLAALLALALGAVLTLRRRPALSERSESKGALRRRRPALSERSESKGALLLLGAAALLAVGLAGGCDCGTGGGDEAGTEVPGACTDESCAPGGCCADTGSCVDLPAEEGFCEPGYGCLDADGNFTPTWDPDTCTWSDECCAELPELSVGFVGQHSEIAVTPDGTVLVSAYSAGLGERSEYGDLVVGTWDDTAGELVWEHVDGVPTTGDVTGSPSGWRGGISTPGDDVGKYTTIAVGADGEPRVAYYDVTHGA
ncbi:MAG: hypothetical protein HY907_15575, partial [Deltaproteobacteria bacterium]|nr:hypothetical protein [Deltaproteobacteria bacterium]